MKSSTNALWIAVQMVNLVYQLFSPIPSDMLPSAAFTPTLHFDVACIKCHTRIHDPDRGWPFKLGQDIECRWRAGKSSPGKGWHGQSSTKMFQKLGRCWACCRLHRTQCRPSLAQSTSSKSWWGSIAAKWATPTRRGQTWKPSFCFPSRNAQRVPRTCGVSWRGLVVGTNFWRKLRLVWRDRPRCPRAFDFPGGKHWVQRAQKGLQNSSSCGGSVCWPQLCALSILSQHLIWKEVSQKMGSRKSCRQKDFFGKPRSSPTPYLMSMPQGGHVWTNLFWLAWIVWRTSALKRQCVWTLCDDIEEEIDERPSNKYDAFMKRSEEGVVADSDVQTADFSYTAEGQLKDPIAFLVSNRTVHSAL